jgi:hypothetical protein
MPASRLSAGWTRWKAGPQPGLAAPLLAWPIANFYLRQETSSSAMDISMLDSTR